ncbi:MAG: dethiobiotin synthase [Mycobacteriaceae bacterium]
MTIMMVTGTGTEVGKTVTTAAVASAALRAGRCVAVVKPAQTGLRPGEPGDITQVTRLAPGVRAMECYRYPQPLAPTTAARRSGLPAPDLDAVAVVVAGLATTHDLVLVEGAGGLLVSVDSVGRTLADLALLLDDVQVLVVAAAGLGTLNATALTAEALATRNLACAGVVVGSWPSLPGLAERSNLDDLPVVARAPLLGLLPAGIGELAPAEFTEFAQRWLHPTLGGYWRGSEFD